MAEAPGSEFDVVMVDVRSHDLSGAGPADVCSLVADLAALVARLNLGGFARLQTNRLSRKRRLKFS